jgi:hypothetical protein
MRIVTGLLACIFIVALLGNAAGALDSPLSPLDRIHGQAQQDYGPAQGAPPAWLPIAGAPARASSLLLWRYNNIRRR